MRARSAPLRERELRLLFGRTISLVGKTCTTGTPHVTLTGVIERLEDDPELADIDRLALRYQGHRFRNREAARVSAWMRCERWYRWD